MAQKEDLSQDSASIFEEIEIQLETLLSEKKQKIQEELEDTIEKERREAEDKISNLEREVTEEKDSLHSYRLSLAEYDNERQKLKAKIREHLAKAMEYQPQIEALTAQTFDELKKVMELNKQLEEINAEAMSRVDSIKQKLEDKYGIKPPESKQIEYKEVQFNLDRELEKLKKIKELLGENSFDVRDNEDSKPVPSAMIPPRAELEKEGTAPVYEPGMIVDKDLKRGIEEAEAYDEAGIPDEEDTAKDEKAGAGPEDEEPAGEMEGAEESLEEKEALLAKLESFRRETEGEKNIILSYFENEGLKLLDGQEVLETVTKAIAETEGLFDRLKESDSPKEQFFTKQEILWHQETLREYIQEALQMCEKEKAKFPKPLENIFNPAMLKDLQKRLQQESLINTASFTSFKEYAKELRADFLDQSTPQLVYLQSLLDELKAE